VLLGGPPGKTYMVNAMAIEAGVPSFFAFFLCLERRRARSGVHFVHVLSLKSSAINIRHQHDQPTQIDQGHIGLL
jgi:hypothetical protein